jgi:hypothetical protein
LTATATRLLRSPAFAAVPFAGGGAVAIVATRSSPELAVACVAALMLVLVVVAKPWLSVPLIVVGGAIGDRVLGLGGVTGVIALRGGLIAVACVGLAARRLQAEDWGQRMRTGADRWAVALAAAVVVSAAWGLAAGHQPHQVVVAAYELLIVPVYFFLATLTLNAPDRLWAAGRVFCAGTVVTAAMSFGGSGHGGLLSSIAALGTIALAGEEAARGRTRALLVLIAAVFLVDVALSGYRAVWAATGLGVVLLALSSAGARRAVVAVTAVGATAALLVVSLGGGSIADRARSHATASSGYRSSETKIGFALVAAAPVAGHGLGRVAADRYVDTFGYKDVGPVFHAFYMTVAVNLGVTGLVLIGAFLLSALRGHLRPSRIAKPRLALAYRCLLAGWIVAAAFAGPTDGHWELGLLPAVALLVERFAADRRARDHALISEHRNHD